MTKKTVCNRPLQIFIEDLQMFIEEEWLSLFVSLNTSLSRQFCSEILLKIGKNIF